MAIFLFDWVENSVGKGENASNQQFWVISGRFQFNSKKRYDVKNIDKWGYSYLIEWKTSLEKEKLLVTSNLLFSHNVFKSRLLLMRQNEYLWSKGLTNLKKEAFENIVEKGENAANQHFLLFPQCFLPYQRQKLSFWQIFYLVVCTSFQPDRVEIFVVW